jgi:hypothetical protein
VPPIVDRQGAVMNGLSVSVRGCSLTRGAPPFDAIGVIGDSATVTVGLQRGRGQ